MLHARPRSARMAVIYIYRGCIRDRTTAVQKYPKVAERLSGTCHANSSSLCVCEIAKDGIEEKMTAWWWQPR